MNFRRLINFNRYIERKNVCQNTLYGFTTAIDVEPSSNI